jgi:ABC-2 type transport system ATP-binding protein
MEPPQESMTMDTAIQIQAMSCRFGALEAVRKLTLEVPTGSIYAFLGTNGAGKTTTIKALLNLIQPSAGSARVLGVDSARLSPRELARIAYVSENQLLPERLTVQQLVSYCAALYPTWDEALCRHMAGKFALPPNQPLNTFSRGMKIKAALLVSLAYRPELLLLDEPFGGLDPLMRDDLIQGLLELSGQENWTVFISSHDIDEVERLADYVGVIDSGVLALSEPAENLRTRYRRVDAILEQGAVAPPALLEKGILLEASGSTMRWIESHYISDEELESRIRAWLPDCRAWTATPLTLREIFIALTRARRAIALSSS